MHAPCLVMAMALMKTMASTRRACGYGPAISERTTTNFTGRLSGRLLRRLLHRRSWCASGCLLLSRGGGRRSNRCWLRGRHNRPDLRCRAFVGHQSAIRSRSRVEGGGDGRDRNGGCNTEVRLEIGSHCCRRIARWGA